MMIMWPPQQGHGWESAFGSPSSLRAAGQIPNLSRLSGAVFQVEMATAVPRTPMALLRGARSLQGFNSFLGFRHPAAVSEGIELQGFRTILADAVGPPQR